MRIPRELTKQQLKLFMNDYDDLIHAQMIYVCTFDNINRNLFVEYNMQFVTRTKRYKGTLMKNRQRIKLLQCFVHFSENNQ